MNAGNKYSFKDRIQNLKITRIANLKKRKTDKNKLKRTAKKR